MTYAPLSSVAGLLLAGGHSRRFGSEKAVAQLGDRPLLDLVAARFRECAAFAVSARPGSAAAQYARIRGWTVLHDNDTDPAGPLAGVDAGLHWAEANLYTHLAVAPCDTPLIPHDLFTMLYNALGDAPAAYAATASGAHPLCSIWAVSLREMLSANLLANAHPPVLRFLQTHGAIEVHFPNAPSFANANTPDSLLQMACSR